MLPTFKNNIFEYYVTLNNSMQQTEKNTFKSVMFKRNQSLIKYVLYNIYIFVICCYMFKKKQL